SPREVRRAPKLSDCRSVAELLIGCFGCMSWPESFLEPGCWRRQRPSLNTHHVYEAHAQREVARIAESIQGTRSRPRLAPAKCRNLRLWVVAAPPEDRLIRV